MESNIENIVSSVLDGKYFEENVVELCDWTVEQQNRTMDADRTKIIAGAGFTPILEKSITYIVACILINDDDDVLMMQEAKQSCAGTWYLPAGRMERGESIREAAVREVYEETGLNVEISTMLSVECVSGTWIRFVVTGNIIGGELKTPAKADKESLQAKWIHNLNELSLRAKDIHSIIDLGREYKKQSKIPLQWHRPILPLEKSHIKNYLRIVGIIKKRSTNAMHILVSKKVHNHLPLAEMHPNRSIHSTLRKFLQEFFGSTELPQHRPHGILALEHCPTSDLIQPADGICLTLLVIFRPPLEEIEDAISNSAEWMEVSKNVENRLVTIFSMKNSSLNLNVRH